MPSDGLRRFDAAELRRFLAALDTGTTDIDTWETDLAAVQPAAERAREVTGLQIPVGEVAVERLYGEVEAVAVGRRLDAWRLHRQEK